MLVTVREVVCKSIVSRCGIAGIDYSINPYTGCQHACAYCYARFMLRYREQSERWGEFVDVKVNAPEILSKQLPKLRRGLIWVSSVTDPYQILEEKYELTRKLLQELLAHQFPITILSKSKLVLRDLELFTQFRECEVGMTVITLDEDVRKRFEPGASTIAERLETLKRLNEAGVRTYAFLGPLLPLLSETIEELASQLREVGVGRVMVDRLNIKGGNWKTIAETVAQHYPELLPRFREALFSQSSYYDELKEKVAKALKKSGLSFSFCY